jgi:hypothetical protein
LSGAGNFWCYLRQISILFGADLASQFKKFMPELHFQMVLFWTNLVSNISTKAFKSPYLMLNQQILVGTNLNRTLRNTIEPLSYRRVCIIL